MGFFIRERRKKKDWERGGATNTCDSGHVDQIPCDGIGINGWMGGLDGGRLCKTKNQAV